MIGRWIIIPMLLTSGRLFCNAVETESSPTSTVLRVAEAIRAEDKAAYGNCFDVEKDSYGEALLSVVLDTEIARQRLHRVSMQRFNRTLRITEAFNTDVFVTADTIKELAAALAKAKVDIDGATAHIVVDLSGIKRRSTTTKPATSPASAERTVLLLKKIDGMWKIDADAMLGVDASQNAIAKSGPAGSVTAKMRLDAMAVRARVWKEVADNIEANRYQSAEAANQALSSANSN
jgi:hypothetical protein